MRYIITVLTLSIFSFSALGQVVQKDTVSITPLSEVVVTGQFEPQSVKKSVFNVRVITSEDIQNLAANNLGDVLNQYLNIVVRPSGRDGRSTVSMFGLDSQYFKILVDNVPLVNEAGLGNNIDLSQVNLNDIERIEIVEGSMGVTHGANAVSGILNIITKKSSSYKWSVSATTQEETVNNEFELFDKGRHIQTIRIAHTINKNWFASVGVNRNDFQGYLANKKGKNYFQNDSLRGYTWLPKEQIAANALVSYEKNSLRIFYKFEYLDENIDYYNSAVQSNYSAELGSYRLAFDKRYFTNRYYHHLNATGKLFSQLNYNVSVSHQKQVRNVEDFEYYLFTRTEANNVKKKDQSMEVFYSTGTVSNFFKNKNIDFQLGYEFVSNNGFANVADLTVSPILVSQVLKNYDFFASSEVRLTEKFSIRPGFRYSIQSEFKEQHASSLGLRYLLDNGLELRGSFGNSFRTPTSEELYYRFISGSHDYVGNENLIPETSKSIEVSVKKATLLASGLQISNTVAGSFMDVKDRIDIAYMRTNSEGIDEFQYININKYRMWNVSSMNQFKKDNWNFNFGAALVGISQLIENQMFASDDKFLYSFNLNSSISYSIPKWNSVFSAYYKYNGRTQQFRAASSSYVISEIEESNWLDASFRKSFLKNKLDITVGARNILDITNIRQSQASQGAGHAESSSQMLAYGRSYFVKLTYNLNF